MNTMGTKTTGQDSHSNFIEEKTADKSCKSCPLSHEYLKRVILDEDKRIGLGEDVERAEKLIELLGKYNLEELFELTEHHSIEQIVEQMQIFNAVIVSLSYALNSIWDDDSLLEKFRSEFPNIADGSLSAWSNFYGFCSTLMFDLLEISKNVQE